MPAMATVQERVGVLETKVDGLTEKIDDIKLDVKESHQDIKNHLKTMYDASCTQHAELATKIKDLEGFKMKWTYMALGGVAVLGWVSGHIDSITAFLK
jgi:hypothetical protein